MSFTIKHGDLFANVNAGYIMHGCNAQGVMGSGVAKIIRNMYPKAYDAYREQHPYYILGEAIPVQVTDNLVIINAITQEFYGTDRRHADYDAIRQAMKGAVHIATSGTFTAPPVLHMPFIGAGLAGGDSDTILAIMDEELTSSDVDATLWIYE